MHVVLTNVQRVELAVILSSSKVKLAGLIEMKAFNHARLALRLNPIMDAIFEKKNISAKTALDKTPRRFELSNASATLLLDKVPASISENTYLVSLLTDFLESLESGGDHDDTVLTLAETEVWTTEGPVSRTYDELRSFFGLSGTSAPVDVLAACEALCTPVGDATS